MDVPQRWIQYPGLSGVCPSVMPFEIALAPGMLSDESAVSRYRS